MEKRQFLEWLEAGAFQEIFQDLGWNAPTQAYPVTLTVPSTEHAFDFREVAQLGVRVFVCETDQLPLAAERSILDARLRKMSEATYIAVFVERKSALHHLWMVPVKNVDKRTLVTVEYTTPEQADFLYAKLADFTFAIGDVPNVLDVIDSVNRAFALNATKVTKTFYKEFQKKHKVFEKGIQKIAEDYDREWYASVMLNRLMFCYFIQKKGFLDLDKHYLRNKLNETQKERGKGKFYGSFYRDFLRVLFVDGLNARQQTDEFKKRFGRIPYLNGGMFEKHILEDRYPEIDIPDEVFEELFAFFDDWNWHLDTSLTASGKDINPDVLGYIFEQYINDRAQMGAYYTKEDITEYIARNTILPWLFNETAKASPAAFKPNGEVWTFLRESGERFIFAAMRKGLELPLPPEIEQGVDTTKPELRKRRAEWNKPAHETHALPTEIWRETVARRLRAQELRDKIATGEITEINDFITYNLDIREFAEQLLSKTQDHLLVKHFYDALCRVTILDPTCGSGAFLFAALNILEPLYEICLTRMQEDWPDKFKGEMESLRVKYRGNLKYCIYKNIILRNLYGVDIMREATEIARLRLFLKMVAVVDVDEMADNLGLDPLPDIDFNIRCGNTLVGFVNPEDVKKAILPPDELALDTEAFDNVQAKAADVSDMYERFKLHQQTDEGSIDYYKTKKELKSRLSLLNSELDRAMAHRQYGISTSTLSGEANFKAWKQKAQPFHWYSEFYGIVIDKGGFDVIIGNPPYVEYKKIKNYKVLGYKTVACGNLYAYVIERAESLISKGGCRSMIIPHSAICTDRMAPLFNIFVSQKGWFSTYDIRPAKLFDGVDQRLLIYILGSNEIYSTSYKRWKEEARENLFSTINYTHGILADYTSLGKFENEIEQSIYQKVCRFPALGTYLSNTGNVLYYHNAPRYFIRFTDTPPYFYSDKQGESISVQVKNIKLDRCLSTIAAAYNSSLFYWWFVGFSDCRHLLLREIESFHIPDVTIPADIVNKLFADYQKNVKRKETFYKATGRVVYDEFYPKLSKPILDELDALLAQYYGFTEEELDFIINYDIKYRMGDELNNE